MASGLYDFTISGLGGPLGNNPAHLNRQVRLTTLGVHRRLGSYVTVGLEAEAHHLQSSVSTAVWRLFGASVAAVAPLGMTGLEATGAVAFFPVTSVRGSSGISHGGRAEFGIGYRLSGVPIDARLGYRMEALSLPGAVNLRFGAVVLGAGVGLGLGR